ncbi:MAG: glycerol-3-phosphate acyltransferase [Coriobacteriaceae bacterium]|jgi:glycerol-3-phosphate acyltransferase PlsY|nr:glycerol-3-phosphate acyltransferase [Coriobacteriaceae bacterium]
MSDFIDVLVLCFMESFLLGSIPFGLVISRLFFKTDIRSHGSGNIGTTNAIRAMGKPAGYAVFVLDFGKGLLSGFLAAWLCGAFFALRGTGSLSVGLFDRGAGLSSWFPGLGAQVLDLSTQAAEGSAAFAAVALSLAFLGCIGGHIFSPWLRFKGGKGIAVAVGCMFATFGPVAAVAELALFAILVAATRYVSFGSVAAALLCLVLSFAFFWGNWLAVALCSLAALTVVWAHRENIKRLVAGTERRVGKDKRSTDGSPGRVSEGDLEKNPGASSEGGLDRDPDGSASGSAARSPLESTDEILGGSSDKNPSGSSAGSSDKNPGSNSARSPLESADEILGGSSDKNPNGSSAGSLDKSPGGSSAGNMG